jgi:hypothetical protein
MKLVTGAVIRHAVTCAVASLVVLVGASAAYAGTLTFGSDLSAVPTLDTANGAYSNNGDPAGPENALLPNPHAAEDATVWNATMPSGSPGAPVGGQVTGVKVEGCAIEDTTAPSQDSQGTPVNTVLFQVLVPQTQPDGSINYTPVATAGNFLMPFCSSSADPTTGPVNTSTVTTFSPVHECVSPGDLIAFHDIGGFIPPSGGGGPWYPQGTPFDVIALLGGSEMNSYIGFMSGYGPNSPPEAGAGFASEPREQLEMQMVEGTGGDAYGLCPGGSANEPGDSNQVICDYGTSSEGHPACDRNGNPITGTTGSGTGTGTGTGTATGTGTGTGSGKGSGTGSHSKSVAPTLGALRLSASSFRAAAGMNVDYSNTVAGHTTLRMLRLVAGKRSGKQCVPPSRSLHHARSCTRLVQVKRVTHQDTLGANSVRVTNLRLSKGRYRLTATTTLSGRASPTLQTSFRILAPRH